jgi:Ca2+-binding RTX toxin-like protein
VYRPGTGEETITGGTGTDQFSVTSATALTSADSLDGGLGSDTLSLSLPTGTTFDLRTLDLQSIEQLSFNPTNGVLLVDQASLTSFTNLSGNSTARLLTDEAALNLTNKFISGLTVASSNVIGTEFTINNLNNAFQILGGPGDDTLTASGFNFTALQRDAIFAGSSIEVIRDSTGFYGNGADNTISGTASADTIQGGAGDDVLIGGGGPDLIVGGLGSDIIVFGASFGEDTIGDLNPMQDVIQFDAAVFANAAAVMAATEDDGLGNSVITYDSNNTITLTGVQKAQLVAGSFDFV